MKIILKLKKEFNVPYLPSAELQTKDKEFLQYWEDLKKIIPDLTLQPLFTVIPLKDIELLVAKAIKTDPTYKPVDFSRYFYMPVTGEFNIQLLFTKTLQLVFDAVTIQRDLVVGDAVDPTDDIYYARQEHLREKKPTPPSFFG